MRTNFENIRRTRPIVEECTRRGISLRASGAAMVAPCPIHQEQKGQSFAVYPTEARWHCFGKCSRGGDITDLVAELDGVSVIDAARSLGGIWEGAEFVPRLRPPRTAPVIAPPLAGSDLAGMNRAAHALAHNADLCRRIAERRGWEAETLRRCALEGDLGHEEGKMMFGYSRGIKARWKDVGGQRVIRWVVGKAERECWRQSLLKPSHRRVIFAEGETDVLALLSTGIEDNDQQTLVVGLASASTMPDPAYFRGKEAIVFPDRDAAGEKAAQKLAKLLQPYANAVRVVNWEGIE